MHNISKHSRPGNMPYKGEPVSIYENDSFIAINKPPNLLTIPDRFDETIISLYKILEKRYQKIFIVHRLDKETSGIILFAKDDESHKHFSRLFENRIIKKFYLGIVRGSLQNKIGVIDEPITEHPSIKGVMIVNKKGKPSVTDYEVIEDFGLCTLVKFQIHSGRTHQIRVHMKHLGHPLLCDEIYGTAKAILLSSFKKNYKLSNRDESERPILNRLALHSSQLKFTDITGNFHNLTAGLPRDMDVLLKQLRKW